MTTGRRDWRRLGRDRRHDLELPETPYNGIDDDFGDATADDDLDGDGASADDCDDTDESRNPGLRRRPTTASMTCDDGRPPTTISTATAIRLGGRLRRHVTRRQSRSADDTLQRRR